MPPAVIRWQIGQTAICHCTGSPRPLAVLRGGANRMPMLEVPDSEPHECPTARKRSKLGRPGRPESATVRLSVEALTAAKARAEEAGTTPRALIESLILPAAKPKVEHCYFCRHTRAECHCVEFSADSRS